MRSLLALWLVLVALSSLEPEVKGVEEDYCCSAVLDRKERLDK